MKISMGTRSATFLFLPLVLLLPGCEKGAVDDSASLPVAGSAGPLADGAQMPADHPPIGLPGAGATPTADAPEGTVKETMDSAGYTYVLLDLGGEEVWAAGPPTTLAVGDRIALVGTMGMTDFRAASLDRTFDRILFVSAFAKR